MFTFLLSGFDDHPRDVSALRMGLSGAASLSVDHLEAFEAKFGAFMLEVYGLTESTGLVTANPVYGVRKPGSIGMCVSGVAPGERLTTFALAYAPKRLQFGSPIARQQGIMFKLAEMATELEAARLLVYRAAIKKDREAPDVTLAASMAKLYATEAAWRAIDQAVQIHGGVGVMRGSRVERLYREIRPLRIYEGTTEIQKLVISRALFKAAKKAE